MMTLLGAMRTSSSGMAAERFRMDVISSNIANAGSVGKNGQEPYRRRIVEFTGGEDGVKITGVMEDRRPFNIVNEPGNPNADAQGNVVYSNINPVEEMVSMISATRAYEANIAAFNSIKGMVRNALSIGKI